MSTERLWQQIRFIAEIDKMKRITRQNYISGGERHETDAEHSWHLAVMALLLAEYAESPLDVLRVVKMVLIHDIVEIDAGDTYCYDRAACQDQEQREMQAAHRLFGMLPPDQAGELHGLWEEFEAARTSEARMARAIDRLQPLLLHCLTEGKSWQEHGISSSQVRERNKHTAGIAPELGGLVNELIAGALEKQYLIR